MKQFVLILGLLHLANSAASRTNYYSDMMLFTEKQGYGEQRIEKIELPITILSVCQVQYSDNFGLSMSSNITRTGGDYDQFSLNMTLNFFGNNRANIKLTVRFVVMKEMPFIESMIVNLTSATKSRIITSARGITSSENIGIAAFCIGFSYANITNSLYYDSDRGSTNYTVYSSSGFRENDWIVVNLVIVDSNPSIDQSCTGSFVVPVRQITSKSSSYDIQKRANLEYIFGIEAFFFAEGNITFNHSSIKVRVTRGLFDSIIIFLNPRCPAIQNEGNNKNDSTIIQKHPKAFLVLTIVFASLFGLLLIAIILYFLCCFRRHAFMTFQNQRSNVSPPQIVPETRVASDFNSEKKSEQSEKFESEISKPGSAKSMLTNKLSEERRPQPDNMMSDTRLIHMPKRHFYRAPVISRMEKKVECTQPNCTNNPYSIMPRGKFCQMCNGANWPIEEITQ